MKFFAITIVLITQFFKEIQAFEFNPSDIHINDDDFQDILNQGLDRLKDKKPSQISNIDIQNAIKQGLEKLQEANPSQSFEIQESQLENAVQQGLEQLKEKESEASQLKNTAEQAKSFLEKVKEQQGKKDSEAQKISQQGENLGKIFNLLEEKNNSKKLQNEKAEALKKQLQWEIQKTFFKMFILTEVDSLLAEEGVSETKRVEAVATVDGILEKMFKDYENLDEHNQAILKDFISNFYPQYQNLTKTEQLQLRDDINYFQGLTPIRKEQLYQAVRTNLTEYLNTTNDLPSQKLSVVVKNLEELVKQDNQRGNSGASTSQEFDISKWTSSKNSRDIRDELNFTKIVQQTNFDQQFEKFIRENNKTSFNQTIFDGILEDLFSPENMNLSQAEQQVLKNQFNLLVTQSLNKSSGVTDKIDNEVPTAKNETNDIPKIEQQNAQDSSVLIETLIFMSGAIGLSVCAVLGIWYYRRNKLRSRILIETQRSDNQGISQFFQKSEQKYVEN